ncbi:MAG: potassium channel family protein [Fimbriimonadaceae bacterium]
MYIVIIGGGNVGIQLGKKLVTRGHEVLIIEKDWRTVQRLSNVIGDEHVMHGDACDLALQKSAGFNRADVVIAVTGEDEDNLVACQMAKEMYGVERVIARVNDPLHEEIFKQLGIDDTVSATGTIYNLIEQQISSDEMVPIGALHKGHLEVVENVLSSRSPVVGKRVRELDLPSGTFLVYLQRDGVGNRIDGDTELKSGDVVVALVPFKHADTLRGVLCSE